MTRYRPHWDEYFLSLCDVIKTRSDCVRRQVGAVIVSSDKRIIATGYNGSKPGQLGCSSGACPRGKLSYEEIPAFSQYSSGNGSCIAVHAEENALNQAMGKTGLADLTHILPSCIVYISCQPCEWCGNLLRAARVGAVVWPGMVEQWG